jgi:hypothetical protein
MKTFFETYCATDTVSIDQLKTFIDNKIKDNDYNGLSSKYQNNSHDFGDYATVDIYINMIEPDFDDDDSDEAYQYDMLIDQAKQLSEAINEYLYDTN